MGVEGCQMALLKTYYKRINKSNMTQLNTKKDFSKYKILKLDQLVKAEWNYKKEDHNLTEKLKNNLKRNGQVENIIVRQLETGFYEVVNGNHRYDAMKQLGYQDIIVCDKSPMTLSEAKRVAIESNETRFESDEVELAKVIKDISVEEWFDIDSFSQTTPFSKEEVENFINLTDFDWDQYSQQDQQDNDSGNQDGSIKTLLLKLDSNVYEAWITWYNRVQEINPKNSEQKAFEIMVIECLNNPHILDNLSN